MRAHEPYAIEDCSVRRAVASRRPHRSIVVAAVSAAPARDKRLAMTNQAAAVEDGLARVRAAFAA